MAGRKDSFTTQVGSIRVVIDYAAPVFHLAMPSKISPRELVRALRLAADLGFRTVDFREYDPVADNNGITRIELERTACR